MVTEDWSEESRPMMALDGQFVLDLEGFEGPIDVLLALARDQKVDLIHISILTLANQYIEFIQAARELRIEIAADYLVMAAWLAYLKSRLLLPASGDEDEASGPVLAEALTFQLRRLEAMQQAGARVMQLPRLGMDVFPRGKPEGVRVVRKPVYELSLYELLKAYGNQRQRGRFSTLEIMPVQLFSVEDALERLAGLLGSMPDWQTLASFLPPGLRDPLVTRSAVASTFAASLELARSGKVQLRQSGAFAPLYVRRHPDAGPDSDKEAGA